MTRAKFTISVAALFAACVSEDIASGQFTCFTVGSRDECPEGLVCSNDLYCRESVSTLDGSAGVAGSAGGGAGGDTGAPAKCSQPADWTSSLVEAGTGSTRPQLVARPSHSDVALTWIASGNIQAQRPLGSPTIALSQSGNVQSFRGAWSDADDALAVVWVDPSLSFGRLASDDSVTTTFVYSADPLEPEGKGPVDGVIAAAPGGGFGVAWKGFADCARRWFGVRLDASGNKIGAPYTRLTDQPCGSFTERMAIASTGDSFVLVWADNRAACDPSGSCSGCACSPSSASWAPDLYWLIHDVGGDASQSTQTVAAATTVSDYPAVAWDGTQAGIAWLEGSAVWFARASGGPVPATLAVEATTQSDSPPSVSIGPSEFAVAWQSAADVRFAAIDVAGTQYDVTIATDGSSGDAPSVAWDGASYFVAQSVQSGGIRVASCTP